ncbi:hypothetical protein HMSSN139_67470 [Paenibacillus sp. HMSSN-139]|nr:hypothetical protein HMSSN139_67470 [Paenibacillus sp. HMSSN-139]
MNELALTRTQYDEIVSEIWKNHRWCIDPMDEDKKECHKYIKYVRPSWDMRDGSCFSITFDGLINGGTINFNAGFLETRPMYDRIMEWLNGPNGKEGDK